MARGLGLVLSLVALLLGPAFASAKDTLRLEWLFQGQFAGPIVAAAKGYYKEAGVDLELLPAGPDLKPSVTVAQGVDTFGIGHPNQIIAARANGAPLVMVSQYGHKSATVYVARADSGITSLDKVKGRSVGLWFGGDEFEFLAMLNAAGIPKEEVTIVPQGYDIVGWLNGQYDVMQVTVYNELLQVYKNGFPKEKLVIFDPSEQGVAFVNTGLFTTEETIKSRPEVVQAVVNATLRGWREAIADPKAAAELVVKMNSELKVDEQVEQIRAMAGLFCSGPTLSGEFGKSVLSDWETVQKIMLDAKLISAPIDLAAAFTNAFWEKAPKDDKTIACP